MPNVTWGGLFADSPERLRADIQEIRTRLTATSPRAPGRRPQALRPGRSRAKPRPRPPGPDAARPVQRRSTSAIGRRTAARRDRPSRRQRPQGAAHATTTAAVAVNSPRARRRRCNAGVPMRHQRQPGLGHHASRQPHKAWCSSPRPETWNGTRLPRRGPAEGDRGRQPQRAVRAPTKTRPHNVILSLASKTDQRHPGTARTGRRGRAEQPGDPNAFPEGARSTYQRPQAGPVVRPGPDRDQPARDVAAAGGRPGRRGRPIGRPRASKAPVCCPPTWKCLDPRSTQEPEVGQEKLDKARLEIRPATTRSRAPHRRGGVQPVLRRAAEAEHGPAHHRRRGEPAAA